MRSPKVRCQFVQEMWGPHEGCAEFMAGPEFVFHCPLPATHQGFLNIPYIGRERLRTCKIHAPNLFEGSKFYRFRRL